MRIGVLTGGGDVPGLNPAIQTITRQAADLGWEIVGIRRGWCGLLEFDLNDAEASATTCLSALTPASVRTIDTLNSTVLQTSRTTLSTLDARTAHILKVIEHLELDALIAIGGVHTLAYGARLQAEGVKINTIPKTMDNDVFGTDYCIGFSTAVSRSVDAINALRTPAGSHERVGFVELFGRKSGETALMSGYLADARRVLIAEVPFDMERLADMLMKDRADNPSNYTMAVISEGARIEGSNAVEYGDLDASGERRLGGISDTVSEEFKRLTGAGTISQKLAYLMRTGTPDALDTMVARSMGARAVQHLQQGEAGVMMAVRNGAYESVPVSTCTEGQRRVDVAAYYDANEYRPNIHNINEKPMFLG
ncbi:MAG: 6-phosphofructokinase [Candidatus Phaeomarinobacter sp.]